ncbi:PREDICTED: zinc finger BED domain-containing protein RICESLEEPER 2-like [Nicotiana attenuata]|uniref:zinc finger BED domain-containing protein RICESLEEPER 2-like n=1 Tax=Nicotiana attenuata TaxID=49451 RepID=UPI0009045F7F|nr:PREDICTED: zinc finger BED domain-containing protein RICESLEEPER 2-like [Nicotiana attenuata]
MVCLPCISGHDTDDFFILKNEIESLIKSGAIQCTPTLPNVNCNPLPNERNQGANMITLDEEYDLKGTIITIGYTEVARFPPRRTLMITVQLKPPVMVQTHQEQSTTIISNEKDQIYKMEIKPLEAEVQEIPQLEGNSTPVVDSSVPTPPKKHKRAAPSENDSGLGSETSDIWKYFSKFVDNDDHKGETIAKGIEVCLLDWGIENLFTVTLDNASANDATIRHLKGRIEDWKGIVVGNDFLHVRCNAHILNLIIKEGLSDHIESISRVRNIVKYVKSSSARLASFKSTVEKVKIDSHGHLSLDVETRWNSTYMMLSIAIKFEKAISRMYIDDHKYQKYCLDMIRKAVHPSGVDWKKVKVLTKFLDIFYQITLKFSGTLCVTSNSFFHELFNLLNFIAKNSEGDDLVMIDMDIKMKLKFDKYWGDFDNMNILLFVAVVLDPRYKMRYVKFILLNLMVLWREI